MSKKVKRTITRGALVEGVRCEGTAQGKGWAATWSGTYVGSWISEGEVCAYFRDGDINGISQGLHGFPIAQLTEAATR